MITATTSIDTSYSEISISDDDDDGSVDHLLALYTGTDTANKITKDEANSIAAEKVNVEG